VCRPPSKEGRVRAEVEALLGRGCFSKGIRDIRAKQGEVLHGSNGIKDAGAGVVGAIGVCVVEDAHLTTTGGPVTCAAGLLTTINLLNG
jgi:hypothetical protein